MPQGDVETYHSDGFWWDRIEGSTQPLAPDHDLKAEAAAAGRQQAQQRKVEHIIRNMDGTIGERNSYGHDPRNIPG